MERNYSTKTIYDIKFGKTIFGVFMPPSSGGVIT